MKRLTDDILTLNELTALDIGIIEPPVISYDPLKRQVLYTFLCYTTLSKEIIIELRIKKYDIYFLEDIKVYTSTPSLLPSTTTSIVTPLTATIITGESLHIPFLLEQPTSSHVDVSPPAITYDEPLSLITPKFTFKNYTCFNLEALSPTIQNKNNYTVFSLLGEQKP